MSNEPRVAIGLYETPRVVLDAMKLAESALSERREGGTQQ
jgi:hypothetical protein